MITFTPELIAGIVGMAISWLFSWFPMLREAFAALKAEVKSGIMLATIAVASVTIYLLAYYGVIQTAEPITIVRLLSVFFVATTLNQAAFSITPEAQSVKDIRTEKVITDIKIVKADGK